MSTFQTAYNMIEYIKKDITTVDRGVIVHGCNCQGVMGSGVAKAIRDTWPEAFSAYREWCEEFGIGSTMLLGSVAWCHVGDNLHVANALTQHRYGKDGKRYASPEAIQSALRQVIGFAAARPQLPVYMPRIGCGLGGLVWETDVEPLIKQLAEEVDIYVCDL